MTIKVYGTIDINATAAAVYSAHGSVRSSDESGEEPFRPVAAAQRQRLVLLREVGGDTNIGRREMRSSTH